MHQGAEGRHCSSQATPPTAQPEHVETTPAAVSGDYLATVSSPAPQQGRVPGVGRVGIVEEANANDDDAPGSRCRRSRRIMDRQVKRYSAYR